MTTRVAHVNDQIEGAVYIGRANGRKRLKKSPFANPFPVKEHGRAGAIALYGHWLLHGATGVDVLAMLPELRNAPALACWCRRDGQEWTPETACHGDLIIEYLKRWTDDELRTIGEGEPWLTPEERLATWRLRRKED